MQISEVFAAMWRLIKTSAPNDHTEPNGIDVARLEPRVLYSAAPVDIDLDGHFSIDSYEVDFSHVDFEANEHFDINLEEFDHDQIVGLADAQDSFAKSDLRRELIVVDARVEGLEQLLADVQVSSDAEVEILVLDPEQDGIEQISETLAGRVDIDAIHIVSHGSAGQVQLGNTVLTKDKLAGYSGQIAGWANALDSDADLLIYGCDLARRNFI